MNQTLSLDQICLKGMSLNELELLCENSGESKFRAKQIFSWMYSHGVNSIDAMLFIFFMTHYFPGLSLK